MLTYSALFAFLALLIFNVCTGRLRLLKEYSVKDYAKIVFWGLFGTFFYYVFYYAGTARMEASQAFIINYLWPIMSVLFACILLKERLTVRKWAAFGLSFLGVLTVAGEGLLRFESGTLIGMLLCVLAALSYGLFCALGCKWIYDDLSSLMISFFVSFLLSAVLTLTVGQPTSVGAPEWLGLLFSGVFVMAVATVCFSMALKRGGSAKISNLAYITPFLSLVWTRLILHEKIRLMSLLGLFLIILGIFIQLKEKQKNKKTGHKNT